jgi:fucose 4-O-acetylase-like acetyltransferase
MPAPMLTDEDAALRVISTLGQLSAEQEEASKAINTILRNGEPFVDVHELFAHYNVLYFRKLLLPRVEVLWSPRLTL